MGTTTTARQAKARATARSEGQDATLARALTAFAQVGAALEGASGVDDLLRVVVRQLSSLIGVERCSVYLRDEKAGLFRGCVGHGGERDVDVYVKRSLAGMPSDGMTLELLRTRAPVVVANAHNDPRIIRSTARFWNIHSMLAVPMILGDEVIGIIHLDDVERPHTFSEADQEIAMVFARLAAVAVAQTQTRIELRSKLDAAGRQIKALRRATAVDERLSELVLAGSGLGEIVSSLADVLGKPCAVVRRRRRPSGDGRRARSVRRHAAAAARAALHRPARGSQGPGGGRHQPRLHGRAASRGGCHAPSPGRSGDRRRPRLGAARRDGAPLAVHRRGHARAASRGDARRAAHERRAQRDRGRLERGLLARRRAARRLLGSRGRRSAGPTGSGSGSTRVISWS